MYKVLIGIPVCLLLGALCWTLWKVSTLGQQQQKGLNEKTVFYDKSVANQFAKIQIGLRIMPSQNTEGNMILMQWTDKANGLDAELG